MLQALSAGPITPAIVATIERQVREVWGGDRRYVGKATVEGKAYRLGAALATGATLLEAIEAAGLTRATGYRILGRKWVIR